MLVFGTGEKMQSSHKILLKKLKTYIHADFRKPFFSHLLSPANPHNSHPRIVIVEKGSPCINVGIDNRNDNIRFCKGSIIYAMPGSPSGILPSKQECATFAVSFFSEYIRIVAYKFHKDERGGELFHIHTSKPLPHSGKTILEVLNQLADQPEMAKSALFLIRALLHMAYTMVIENKNSRIAGKSERTWFRLETYIEAHLNNDLSRKTLSKIFLMNQSYLSFLCRRHTGKSFNEYLRCLRLSNAVMLLSLPFSMDEIAERCGFRYTSYFIHLFKAQYGISPGKFRLINQNVPRRSGKKRT